MYILGEERENGEETAQSAAAFYLVQELEAIVLLIIWRFIAVGVGRWQRSKDLYMTIDDNIEGEVRVDIYRRLYLISFCC